MRLRSMCLFVLAATTVLAPSVSDARDAAFGPDQAKALLPAAAGVERRRIQPLLESSPPISEEQIFDPKGCAPLTLVILYLRPWLPSGDEKADAERAKDFVTLLGSAFTAHDAQLAIGALPSEDASRSTELVSILRTENIAAVTVERTGETATGTVSLRHQEEFEKKPLFTGVLHWSAAKRTEGWRIEEFRLPGCRYRVRRDEDGWKPIDDARPGRALRAYTPAFAAVPDARLPGTAGGTAFPLRGRLEFGVTRTGELHGVQGSLTRASDVRMDLLSHQAFRQAGIAPSGPDRTRIGLRIDRDLPWEVAGWVLAAIEGTTQVSLPLYLVLRGGAEGEERWLAVPPKDPKATKEAPSRRVEIVPDAKAADLGKVDVAFAKDANVEIGVLPGVRAEHVVQVFSWLRGQDVRSVRILPPAEEPPELLPYYVENHPVKASGFAVRVAGATSK